MPANIFNQLERLMNMESAKIRARDLEEERQKDQAEKDENERLQNMNVSARKAIKERALTLDFAWAAAGWLRETDGVHAPERLYTQRTTFWTRKPIPGIATEGWPLLAWRNVRYSDDTHHLLLSPRGMGPSGVHLAYFTETYEYYGGWGYDEFEDEPELREVRPEDVHPLSKIPLSDDDMPWPEYSWPEPSEDGVIEVDDYDMEEELGSYSNDTEEDIAELVVEARRERPISHIGYNRMPIEKDIRTAIARVAAIELVITPERAARQLRTRIAAKKALGISVE